MKYLIREKKLFQLPLIWRSFIHSDAKSTSENGPLHGVRICDMTRVLAGPYCTMVLGDMGAEVIKIEREGIGDETRSWGLPSIKGESYYNLSVNRNKKSVCVDIQKESGRDIIYELVKKSDVFIENYIFGKLDSLGLGYEKLSTINPKLIYCSISGYGGRGVDKSKPGYDLVASAVGGLLHVTGPEDGEPCRPGVAVTDILTGLYAHTAIISALHERTQTNVGKKINVSLLQSQVAMLTYHAASYLNTGTESKRYGSGQAGIVPSRSYETKDRDIVISVTTDVMFQTFCELIGHHDLREDERFKTNSARVENRTFLDDIISNCLKEETSDHWLRTFGDAVPCSLINNIKEAFEHPQVKSLNTVHEIEHPLMGSVKMTGPAVRFNGKSFFKPPIPPPMLGQHTEEVLRSIINSNDDVNEE